MKRFDGCHLAPFRRTDAPSAKEGGIHDDDNGQHIFVDGQGGTYWFVDTTAGNVTVTLPSALESAPSTKFTVKRLSGGANTLTVTAQAGTIDGAATHSIPTQYLSYDYVSDGTNYYIV